MMIPKHAKITTLPETPPRKLAVQLLLGLFAILLFGFLDFVTGRELAFFQFYILPIALITWQGTRLSGFIMAVASMLVWYQVDTFSGDPYSHPAIAYWNAISRLLVFMLIVYMVDRIKQTLSAQTNLARLDGLTGAANSTYFLEILHTESKRSRRNQQPLTLVYLDLDNFKQVNDTMGHGAGDAALKVVVGTIRESLRETDSIGRMGGDEFSLLLPETGQAAARAVVQRLQEKLLAEMAQRGWPITFSMGVLTCTGGTCTIDDLIRQADNLMYQVKRAQKNNATYLEI